MITEILATVHSEVRQELLTNLHDQLNSSVAQGQGVGADELAYESLVENKNMFRSLAGQKRYKGAKG